VRRFRPLSAGVGPLLLALASPAGAGSLETAGGIQVAVFPLKAGTIYVNLPDDLAPGDTASATVNPVPAGEDAREREKKLAELHEYTVELAGGRAPASEGIRTFTIPAGSKALPLLLLDRRGRKQDEVKAQVGAAATRPERFEVPLVGQGGSAVAIAGPFDGDLSNSSVSIGGEEAEPMAESPRQLLVRGPREGAVAQPLEVRERGAVVAAGTYRNVAVSLSAGATRMRSGQCTTLTISVTGVGDLEHTLPLRLTNHTPGVVSMEGGEEQTLCVHADEVKDGTWTASRKLEGVSMGGFSVGAEVSQAPARGEEWVRVSAKLQGELRARLFLEWPARGSAGQQVLAGPYEILVRGTAEAGEVGLLLAAGGEEAGAFPGAVFRRVRSPTPCDRTDLEGALPAAALAAGEPSFHDLGFEDGGGFEIRDDDGRLRLVLANSRDDFTIEAELESLEP
jgi:hypothetical protein